MSLTFPGGPLAAGSYAPGDVNYAIDGPKHRLLMHPFPRRVRAVPPALTAQYGAPRLSGEGLASSVVPTTPRARGSSAPNTPRTARSRAAPRTGRSAPA